MNRAQQRLALWRIRAELGDELTGIELLAQAGTRASARARRARRITYAAAAVWLAGLVALLAFTGAPWEAWAHVGSALLVGGAVGLARGSRRRR